MAKTKEPVDLFAVAAKKPAKKAKDEKPVFSVDDKAVAQAIHEYQAAKTMEDEAKRLKSQSETLIKQYAKEKFLDLYAKSGKRPENFILTGEIKKTDCSVLHIVMDSYKKLAADQYEHIAETYGEDVVEDSSEYVIDKEMIQKYGAEISKAIMSAKTIPAEDKVGIIFKQENYNVAKGTIDRLIEIAEAAETDIATVFEAIVPTQQLKTQGK
jgi:hypothetical protein